MAGYTKELSRPTVVYQDATLVASGASVNSGFRRWPTKKLLITKTHTTGTYAMTLDWSMDGTNTHFTTTPSLSNNTPVSQDVLAPWVKITIAATVASFTVHQTTVMAS
jgi:hypothetical protein